MKGKVGRSQERCIFPKVGLRCRLEASPSAGWNLGGEGFPTPPSTAERRLRCLRPPHLVLGAPPVGRGQKGGMRWIRWEEVPRVQEHQREDAKARTVLDSLERGADERGC